MSNPYYANLIFFGTAIISTIISVSISLVLSGYRRVYKQIEEQKKIASDDSEIKIENLQHEKKIAALICFIYMNVLWFFFYYLINYVIFEVSK